MVEREWREASDMRPSVFIAGDHHRGRGAASLRRASAPAFPFNIGVDEPEIMSRVVQMMRTGDFNPHFFDYPGLVLLPAARRRGRCRFLLGATPRPAGRRSIRSTPATSTCWGRAVTAFFGAPLTVLLVYRIGMRWGARHAALAAGLMAVMPLHVRESHYVLTDVPETFFVTLTLLLTLAAHERERALSFALAGARRRPCRRHQIPRAVSSSSFRSSRSG